MKVRDVAPGWLADRLEELGIRQLYPPQEAAIQAGLLEGASLLVSTPTASGKTLLALLASAAMLERGGGKVVYLTPLRALTSEKLEFFRDVMGDRYRVAAVSSDYDASDEWLGGYDVIIATNEKMDSIIRHRAKWVEEVSLVVADEFHLMGTDRGPALEMTLSRLSAGLRCQLLLLSATVGNAGEVSSLLGLKLVESTWRPVVLREAVYVHRTRRLIYSDGSREEVPKLRPADYVNLAAWITSGGGQAMVFASSRRSAEQMAGELASSLGLAPSEELAEEAEQLRDGGIGSRLSDLACRGVAFHHAGLSRQQRGFVERWFRAGLVRVVVATPTLAAGVNIPARAVIIPDVRRGVEEMSVMEYKQLAGRAGRPGYDEEGLAIIVARARGYSSLMRKYLHSGPEPISSRLGSPSSLRFHVLGLIASGVDDEGELRRFFEKTLAAAQLGLERLWERVLSSLKWLEAAGFVKPGLRPTRVGKRVAELYIHPETALTLMKHTRLLEGADPGLAEDIALAVICMTPDVPGMQLQTTFTAQQLEERLRSFGISLSPQQLAAAAVVKAWINEAAEQVLYATFGAAPGDIMMLSEAASWVCQSWAELSQYQGSGRVYTTLLALAGRIKEGVKPELLPLTAIPGLGRVRARALYNAGYRTPESIVKASREELGRVPFVGPYTAGKIKEFLGSPL